MRVPEAACSLRGCASLLTPPAPLDPAWRPGASVTEINQKQFFLFSITYIRIRLPPDPAGIGLNRKATLPSVAFFDNLMGEPIIIIISSVVGVLAALLQ